jgi:hypothetical protein
MNRRLWTQTIDKTSCPEWICPSCSKGTISLIPGSLHSSETVTSKDSHRADGWDPEWLTSTFVARGICGHASCKEIFSIAGIGGVEPQYTDDEGNYEYIEYYSPKYCYPMPDIFEFPSKCPEDVQAELRISFQLFWGHPASCAGRIRVSLECLMNHLGVPKRRKDKNGKFSDLTLHARIDSFAKVEPTVAPQLMALKWLGNSGSHDSEVTRNDLLDAFEIMEHSLGELIDRRSQRVAALAKKLTKIHGR